mgnify:CR=1 FL=1
MLKHFAFVAEGDVFYKTFFDAETNPAFERWEAAFSSNPLIVNINDYPNVNKGFFFKDGSFFDAEDINMETPLSVGESVPVGVNRYAIICDNEIVGVMTYIKDEMDEQEFYRTEAGLASNPKVLLCPPEVTEGWTWNGEVWAPPV